MRNFFFKGSGAIHFDSVNELDSLAGNLDDAELVPIYAINPFSEECEGKYMAVAFQFVNRQSTKGHSTHIQRFEEIRRARARIDDSSPYQS